MRIILNPASGGGAGRKIRDALERELRSLDREFTIVETRGRGDAVQLARTAALERVPTVVAVGGDGTVHETMNGLMTAGDDVERPALGVVPVGTGNDFAKLLTPAQDVAGAIERLRHATRPFDVGVVEWDGGREYFINGMGTGIDVEVVRNIERMPWMPGVLRYLAGLLRSLVTFRPVQLRIVAGEQLVERRIMIMAVGNGCCIGGGFYVCPDARPDDGSLDLCVVHDMNYLKIAGVLPRVMRGTHTDLATVTMTRAQEFEITAAAEPLFFQLDGELRSARNSSLRVSVVPAALQVHA